MTLTSGSDESDPEFVPDRGSKSRPRTKASQEQGGKAAEKSSKEPPLAKPTPKPTRTPRRKAVKAPFVHLPTPGGAQIRRCAA